MKKSAKTSKRFLAFLVAFVMMVGALPMSVSANAAEEGQLIAARTPIFNMIYVVPTANQVTQAAKTAFIQSEEIGRASCRERV